MRHIFLAHASEDREVVLYLHERLEAEGFEPWLDRVDLRGGAQWKVEISKRIKNSGVFIACLSKTSVAKRGYFQREIRMALSETANRPEGKEYVIPLRLDDCQIPNLRNEECCISLRDCHRVDLFEPDGFESLVEAINLCLEGGSTRTEVFNAGAIQSQKLKWSRFSGLRSRPKVINGLVNYKRIASLIVIFILVCSVCVSFSPTSFLANINVKANEPELSRSQVHEETGLSLVPKIKTKLSDIKTQLSPNTHPVYWKFARSAGNFLFSRAADWCTDDLSRCRGVFQGMVQRVVPQ